MKIDWVAFMEKEIWNFVRFDLWVYLMKFW